MPKPTGLGRGLASLIPDTKSNETKPTDQKINQKAKAFWSGGVNESAVKVSVVANDNHSQSDSNISLLNIPLASIEANPYQPRKNFEQSALDDLVASIREHGILQPLVVVPNGDGYQLIAGERRFRSAQILQLETVPVIVRDVTEQQQLELSLIENIQRQNLNPIEEARSYKQLADEFSLSQEDIAKRVGKSRSKVANSMRLLQLPDEVQRLLMEEKITEGHGKLLLELDSPEKQIALAKKIVRQNLTVRDTGTTVKKQKGINNATTTKSKDPRIQAWEKKLESSLGTKVSIVDRNNKGKIEIEYFSNEELMALIERLSDVDDF